MVLLAVAVAAASCGDADGGAPINERPAEKAWAEADVIEALHLQTENGIAYTSPSGCEVAVIMVTASEVQTYADAGDAVATNPDETAGVKYSPSQPACRGELVEGLSALR